MLPKGLPHCPPSRRYPRTGRLPRAGVSLLELMLVVTLLSVVVAISYPSFRGTLTRNELTNAGRQLQQELQRARLASMESGEMWIFAPTLKSGAFYLGPLADFPAHDQTGGLDSNPLRNDAVDLPNSPYSANSGNSGNFAESPDSYLKRDGEQQLPSGFRFVSAADQTPDWETNRWVATDSAAGRERGVSGSDTTAEPFWQNNRQPQVVLFYPNGRMKSLELSLANSDGFRITIEIQGLSGRIKLSPVTREALEPSEGWALNPQEVR
jgi:prepilin-type N-terminal cleavage/methylation domain-containing protein